MWKFIAEILNVFDFFCVKCESRLLVLSDGLLKLNLCSLNGVLNKYNKQKTQIMLESSLKLQP